MPNKIKILISTDSAVLTSGLAHTTRNIFLPLLHKYPNTYEIHQLGFFHFNQNVPTPWPIYSTKMTHGPGGFNFDHEDKYGEKSFDEIVERIKPDIVFGYGDMWHFAPTINSIHRNKYRLLTYYTIDGQPYYGHLNSDESTSWGSNLSKVDQIVTLSHFGKDTLKRSCKELKDVEIKVMYHSLPIEAYPLVTDEMKKANKISCIGNLLGNEDIFICGFVGRNQFRKQNYKLWELGHYMVHGDYIECKDCNRITTKEWDHSSRKSRDISELTLYDKGYDYSYCWHCKSKNIVQGIPNPKFYMWMHTDKNDPGYNMELHQRMWKIESNCIYTGSNGNRVSQEDLIKIMSCFDIGYYPSGGEGYGNFSTELLALGIPMVYSNYSSHAELCRHGGLPVRVTYVPELHHGIQRAVVDNNHAIEQTLKLYRDKDLRTNLGIQGRNFSSMYNINVVSEGWNQIFLDLYAKPLPLDNKKIYASLV